MIFPVNSIVLLLLYIGLSLFLRSEVTIFWAHWTYKFGFFFRLRNKKEGVSLDFRLFTVGM